MIRQRGERLASHAETLGVIVADVIPERGTGRTLHRLGLMQAVRLAKRTDLVIVADNVTRVLRNENPEDGEDLTPGTFKRLEDFARLHGVRFAFRRPVGLPERELHRQRTLDGMRAMTSPQRRGATGRRKVNREGRESMRGLRKAGWSLRRLASAFGVSPSTVSEYLSELARLPRRFKITLEVDVSAIVSAVLERIQCASTSSGVIPILIPRTTPGIMPHPPPTGLQSTSHQQHNGSEVYMTTRNHIRTQVRETDGGHYVHIQVTEPFPDRESTRRYINEVLDALEADFLTCVDLSEWTTNEEPEDDQPRPIRVPVPLVIRT